MGLVGVIEGDHAALQFVTHVAEEEFARGDGGAAGDNRSVGSPANLKIGLSGNAHLGTYSLEIALRLNINRQPHGLSESGLRRRIAGTELIAESGQIEIGCEREIVDQYTAAQDGSLSGPAEGQISIQHRA